MQRSAWGVLAAGLMVLAGSGCAPNQPRVRPRPLPEPPLATRTPTPVQAIPRPQPSRVQPVPPSLPEPPAGDWSPPGGIRRGLWQTIVVHHSGSPKSTPQGMHSWHIKRGWENGLGYHFVIGNGTGYGDGEVFVGPRWKAQLAGAHCRTGNGRYFGRQRPGGYFNEHGIGICLIGNFQTGQPTARQLATLRRLIAYLCSETGITPEAIYGHGEVTHATECPGRNVNVAAIRRSVSAALAGGGPSAAWSR